MNVVRFLSFKLDCSCVLIMALFSEEFQAQWTDVGETGRGSFQVEMF